jgi:UDP-N-acetylmuramyl pentapeptide phosphotransferase/UDP-N-acetylglucosamine-1-phosphate transferase
MTLFHIAFLFFGTVLVSFTTTGAVLAFLKSRGIVDEPNERSSHKLPTPRGGGLAVTLVILGAWGLSLGNALAAHY